MTDKLFWSNILLIHYYALVFLVTTLIEELMLTHVIGKCGKMLPRGSLCCVLWRCYKAFFRQPQCAEKTAATLDERDQVCFRKTKVEAKIRHCQVYKRSINLGLLQFRNLFVCFQACFAKAQSIKPQPNYHFLNALVIEQSKRYNLQPNGCALTSKFRLPLSQLANFE